MKEEISQQFKMVIEKIPKSAFRILCDIHGIVEGKNCYDPHTHKMTGLQCGKCPTIKNLFDMCKKMKADEWGAEQGPKYQNEIVVEHNKTKIKLIKVSYLKLLAKAFENKQFDTFDYEGFGMEVMDYLTNLEIEQKYEKT